MQRISWPRVFLEGAVIVVSILLAFGIDAAWQETTERALEADLIFAIERDMRQNLAEADRILNGNAARTAALRTLLNSSPRELAAISSDSTRVILRQLALVSTFTPYDGSIRTGDLSVLRDPAMRAAIGVWAGVVADATETTALLFDYARDLRLKFGETSLREMTGMSASVQNDHPLVALNSDKAFVESALAMEMTVSAYGGKVTRIQEQTEALLGLLRK
jgi:hypothetical protein